MLPLYSPLHLRPPAYHLRYTWSGWPSRGTFPDLPPLAFWEPVHAAWEQDGLRTLEQKWSADLIQFTFSVKPQVSPVIFAARVKGRLQHALRKAGRPTEFSRKVAVGSVGDNHRADVEGYIERQVDKEQLADPRFTEMLRPFAVADPSVDLAAATQTNSGRYWYNLHVVLVVEQRHRIADAELLGTLRDGSFKIAAKKGYAISRLSVMPDHLHAALRGNIAHSPEDVALAFLNNLAYRISMENPALAPRLTEKGLFTWSAYRRAVPLAVVSAFHPSRQRCSPE
jgi:REP element-mobilizing transposase RayT